MSEALSHILIVPSTGFRLLCGADPKKTKNDTIASTDSPGAATCPTCKACFETLTAPLRKQLTRIAEGADTSLEKYHDWANCGDSGLSSKALVQAITGARLCGPGYEMRHPLDPSDFGRCSRVLARFPELREKLIVAASISPIWARLVEHWDELEQLLVMEEEEYRKHGEKLEAWRHANGRDAYPMYNRMAELIGDRPMAYTPPVKRGGRRGR